MRIIHLSDPHASASPENFRALFDKRIVGFFNYTFRRRFQHDLNLLRKAVDFIMDYKPDAVICTGDVTSTGQSAEFAEIINILDPILRNPQIPFIYVPGNHDAYVKNSSCSEALHSAFSKMNNSLCNLDELPFKTIIKECEFILVNECRPTNIFLSSGYISEKSSEKIIQWCNEEKKYPRILVGHFPVLNNAPPVAFRKRLNNHEKLLDLLNTGKIDLSLCGHKHIKFAETNSKGRGELCAGSITRTGNLTLIEYNKNDDTFSYEFKNITEFVKK